MLGEATRRRAMVARARDAQGRHLRNRDAEDNRLCNMPPGVQRRASGGGAEDLTRTASRDAECGAREQRCARRGGARRRRPGPSFRRPLDDEEDVGVDLLDRRARAAAAGRASSVPSPPGSGRGLGHTAAAAGRCACIDRPGVRSRARAPTAEQQLSRSASAEAHDTSRSS